MALHPSRCKKLKSNIFPLRYLTQRSACLMCSSILKMETICFSETPECFYQTTRYHVPEVDDTPHSQYLLNVTSSKAGEIYGAWILKIAFSFEAVTTFPFCSWKSG
jgi:hypothetical protein